jgi:hypothetical protein
MGERRKWENYACLLESSSVRKSEFEDEDEYEYDWGNEKDRRGAGTRL